MWSWIVTVGCYLFAALFLRLIGGFNAAGEALSRWGAAESRKRSDRVDGFLRSLKK